MLSLGTDIILSPAFDPDSTSYTTSVGNGTSSVMVTATANHLGATVIGTDEKSLNVGASTITVIVTAEDGTTTKTYTITVTRAGSGGGNNLLFPPSIKESTTLTLPDAVDTIKAGESYSFTPTLNSGSTTLSRILTVTVDGTTIANATSDEEYTLYDLAIGAHTIVVSFAEESNYSSSSVTKTVTVNKADAPIESDELVLENMFNDISESAWYYEHVMWAAKNKILNGVGNGLFMPVKPITRAEFITMLARYYKADVDSYSVVSFADVPEGAWYTKYVGWAVANGFINGYGNGKFGPGDILTREQVAVILYNIYKKPPVTGLSLSYADKAQISSWAIDAVAYWSNVGVLNGKENGKYDPNGKFIRAEGATLIHKLEIYERK